MIKHNLWRTIKKSQVTRGARNLHAKWSMKKKANWALQGRLTAHGCSQKDGKYHDSSSIHAHVKNDAMI